MNPQEDLAPLAKANLLFANGYGLDNGLANGLHDAGNPNVKLVMVAEEALRADRDPRPIETDPGSHEAEHGRYDPHAWLGLEEAAAMVSVMSEHLKQADPGRAGDYERRAKEYVTRLRKLHEYGCEALKGKGGRKLTLISGHESLAYFARSLGIRIVAYLEAEPGKSIDPNHLKEMVEMCRKGEVQVIATEPGEEKAADSLLAELDSQKIKRPAVVVVDPLELAGEDDLKDPTWYERKMRENIDALKKYVP
jgi:ABC-type Zn uptake system ZnuABC Zn-binding protein ZnuA